MAQPTIINSFTKPTRQVDPSEGYRAYTVDNSDGILLPGCTSIDEVKLNGVTIPPFIDHRVPKNAASLENASPDGFDTHRVNMYALVDGPEGPTLVRSHSSNDGKWQMGATVHVKGTFEEEDKESEPAPAKTTTPGPKPGLKTGPSPIQR